MHIHTKPFRLLDYIIKHKKNDQDDIDLKNCIDINGLDSLAEEAWLMCSNILIGDVNYLESEINSSIEYFPYDFSMVNGHLHVERINNNESHVIYYWYTVSSLLPAKCGSIYDFKTRADIKIAFKNLFTNFIKEYYGIQ